MLEEELNALFLLPFNDEAARNDTLIHIFKMPRYHKSVHWYEDLIAPRLYEFIMNNPPPLKVSEANRGGTIKHLNWRLGRGMRLPRKFEAKKHKYEH